MYKELIIGLAALLMVGTVASQDCLECHNQVTPSIVIDWQLSKHSDNDVSCATCHGEGHI